MPQRTRLTAVRLTDVPLSTRASAARELARRAVSEEEKLDLIAAALFPSGRVYYVRLAPERVAA